MNNNNHIVIRQPVPAAAAANRDAASASPKRRHATLTLAPCKKRRNSTEPGQAFGGRLECAGHAIWIEDAITLGVVAFVLNIGTVELRLPTFRDRTSELRADQKVLPLDVIALAEGVSWSRLKRQDEAAEALFVRRFATALRICTQSKAEAPSLVTWYRQNLLPAAVRAVPADLRVNERI
ncbi:hypothetical protein ACS5PN_11325 [Roseateles sp. NT4]|uniref:hypothetical protein n=1 Tax=Roseateles sp. NT4 TaxID=3453715 RepID=UPI003EE8C982